MFPFSSTLRLPRLTGFETIEEMEQAIKALQREDPLVARVFDAANHKVFLDHEAMTALAYAALQRYYEQQVLVERLVALHPGPISAVINPQPGV